MATSDMTKKYAKWAAIDEVRAHAGSAEGACGRVLPTVSSP